MGPEKRTPQTFLEYVEQREKLDLFGDIEEHQRECAENWFVTFSNFQNSNRKQSIYYNR